MRTEEEIKEELELLKIRQRNARIAGDHNGYFVIDMGIQILKWVLEEGDD